MRGTQAPVVALTLLLCVLGSSAAQAGTYNPAEAPLIAPDAKQPYEVFRDMVFPLRPVGVPVPPAKAAGKDPAADKVGDRPLSPMARRYELIATLAERNTPSDLPLEQWLSLGDYLIRSKQYSRATRLLEPVYRKAPRDSRNFLLLATLAHAEQMQGQATGLKDHYRRSKDYRDEAVSLWPKKLASVPGGFARVLKDLGWGDEQLEWFKQVERFQGKMSASRAREKPPRPGEYKPLGDDVDAIFDDGGKKPQVVRFVNEKGKFQAGAIAEAEKKKLPADAVRVVQQLLLWMPDDFRLWWLLAELYNAQGDYLVALTIYDLIQTSLSPQADGLPVGRPLRPDEYPETFKQRLAVLRAKVKADADRAQAEAHKEPPVPPIRGGKDQKPAASPQPAPPAALPFDPRSLGVGVIIGAIAGFLGYWQLREFRRRALARAPAGKE